MGVPQDVLISEQLFTVPAQYAEIHPLCCLKAPKGGNLQAVSLSNLSFAESTGGLASLCL